MPSLTRSPMLASSASSAPPWRPHSTAPRARPASAAERMPAHVICTCRSTSPAMSPPQASTPVPPPPLPTVDLVAVTSLVRPSPPPPPRLLPLRLLPATTRAAASFRELPTRRLFLPLPWLLPPPAASVSSPPSGFAAVRVASPVASAPPTTSTAAAPACAAARAACAAAESTCVPASSSTRVRSHAPGAAASMSDSRPAVSTARSGSPKEKPGTWRRPTTARRVRLFAPLSDECPATFLSGIEEEEEDVEEGESITLFSSSFPFSLNPTFLAAPPWDASCNSDPFFVAPLDLPLPPLVPPPAATGAAS
mmetsp:Transcript_20235/g.50380  ORF Transcript_20235/g.50380 Transcript_20235/m.50380 type:complete len:309 (-) Transcript_20235:1596-2522(-)